MTNLNQIKKLEADIMAKKAELAKLVSQEQGQLVEPGIEFTATASNSTLDQLFAGKDELIIVHNMGAGCAYCTMWADGINGVWQHLGDRAGFAVVSPDATPQREKFAASRGWQFPMYTAPGRYYDATKTTTGTPGVSVFKREAGKIYHTYFTEFGPGDNYCIVWDFFNLLPNGVNGWEPQYKY